MNTYGWSLLGQTLLALLALALCGGWALWPFRRAERPYLWLAAPLAGLLTLGGALAVLYFFVGLPFRWCLWFAFLLNAGATVAVLVRGKPALPAWRDRIVALVVLLGAAYWGTVSCNKTAIDAREPTLAAMDGSDMFGYAISADWLRAHPDSERPRVLDPIELLPYLNLYVDGGRPLTFLLNAAAGEVRGTTSLFSYDWLNGVLLTAALLGFGGVFASGSLPFVLLVVGAAASSWLANARTGFLGRSITYPSVALVVGLFLTTVEQFTWRRFAVLAVLGCVVAFSHAPVLIAVVLGMVMGSYVVALFAVYLFTRSSDPPATFRRDVGVPSLTAVVVWAATVLPAFMAYYGVKSGFPMPDAPAQWAVVIPVSLDLEPPVLPLLKRATETKLLYGCAALLVVLIGIALRQRRRAALALLGCAGVVPVSWLLGQNLLHGFQGIVYPLTLAGACLLVTPLATARWESIRVGLLVVLIMGVVGLRVPQVRATADRYIYSVQQHRAVLRQSEAESIRATIGTEPVDVALGHFPDNHLALVELAAHGIKVRLRSPAWDRTLKNWAQGPGGPNIPTPDLLAPKERFALVEKNAWSPPGTERFVGWRLKLIEDRDAVTIMGITGTQDMTWDTDWRPGVWIGNTSTTFLIHNGTGTPQAVVLCADTSAGPAHPDREHRTLAYRLNEQNGQLSLPKENKAAIPLRLAPGLNTVELSVVEVADPPPKPKQPVPLLEFRNWRIEPAK